MPNLQLQLAIYDREPSLQRGEERSAPAGQLWIGGAIDRTSRTVVADPARWISVTETSADTPPAQEPANAVASWDLEQINPGDRPSPGNAGGIVITAMDIDPAVEDEFNDWYNTEHIPILSKLPGMLAARRFRARRGLTRYVALYHVTDTGIYAKPSWYTANETPWMLRMRRYQRNRTYFMSRSSAEATP